MAGQPGSGATFLALLFKLRDCCSAVHCFIVGRMLLTAAEHVAHELCVKRGFLWRASACA